MLASMAEREKNRRKASMSEEFLALQASKDDLLPLRLFSCSLYVVGEIHRWFKRTQNSRNKFIVRGRRNSQVV